MVLDQDLAVEHAHQRVHAEIAGRVALPVFALCGLYSCALIQVCAVQAILPIRVDGIWPWLP